MRILWVYIFITLITVCTRLLRIATNVMIYMFNGCLVPSTLTVDVVAS